MTIQQSLKVYYTALENSRSDVFFRKANKIIVQVLKIKFWNVHYLEDGRAQFDIVKDNLILFLLYQSDIAVFIHIFYVNSEICLRNIQDKNHI